AGRTEAALKTLRMEESLLHRMQRAVAREPFDGRDLATLGAKCRKQTTVHRLAVDKYRARAAIAGVAAFLDAEPAQFAQERAQALAAMREFRMVRAVDNDAHDVPLASSSRISSAKRRVMCLRHAGAPCTSS